MMNIATLYTDDLLGTSVASVFPRPYVKGDF